MGSESIAHVAEWAIDSEAIRARGIIIVLVKSNDSCSWSKILRQNNFSQTLMAFFAAKKPVLLTTSGLQHIA